MKIAVCINQTFDTEAVIRLNGAGEIDKTGVKLIINPFDEFAVEEALRLVESKGGETVLFAVGAEETSEALRQGLAMGADRAVLIQDPALSAANHHGVALALAKAIDREKPDLILSGWVKIDDGSAQIPARIAQILGLPQITVVTKLTIEGDKVVCQREGDGIAHIVESSMPAVVTAQKGLNEPRYPNIKGIMAAKRKPINTATLAELGITSEQIAPKIEIFGYTLPQARKAGRVLEGEAEATAAELASLLRNETKII